ncbi:MAG TPA: penicillin-binding protein 1A [Caulobacteraceae bacterium]|nr:penicillin-binding protein 1A [Caulobacteraceae bacterium]
MVSVGRWTALAGVALSLLVAVAGACLAFYMAWLFHDMPNAADLVDYHPPTATRVYAWDGTLIGEYSTERRIYVPYDQIPQQVSEAFLAAEDHNFFTHGGVDVSGVGRAMFKDIFNILQGRRPEGGSTITQQVAKNVLLTNEASIGRKLKEAILATRLEQALSKQRILELYLNEIWLGHDSYGVGAAAYNYFGKSLNDLTLAQCAFLASLPKGPDNYNPAHHMQAALDRRNAILDSMAQLGWASYPAVADAKREPIVVQPPQRAKYRDADYFVEEVRREALASAWGKNVNQGGYYIRTTLDPRLQTAARIALMDGLETYDRRHGWRGAWGHVAIGPGWERAALANSPPSERKKWVVAVIESVDGGTVKAKVAADDSEGFIVPADVSWARAGKGLTVGDLVFVEPADKGGLNLRQVPAVNGAMVVMDPMTGRVLAMVGGYSFSLSSFNRATQAMRQPGSSFKPFVYITALQNGYTPASMVNDGPITLQGAGGTTWTPENYEHGEYGGSMLFRRGLELSLNDMTVRIAADVGMDKIVANAIRFGVVTKMDPVLSMALGAGETTPYRLTSAYSAFINGGRRINPHLIELVDDRDGKSILRSDERECHGCSADFNGGDGPQYDPQGQQVVDPILAYQMANMLEGVVQHGTAYQAHELGRVGIGGKTGTTNDYRSAWFMGFSPQIVVGTFVGFDDNRSLGHGETGAVAAVPIFIEFMKEALKGYPVMDFTPPPGAEFETLGGNREAFLPGTIPSGRPPSGGGSSSTTSESLQPVAADAGPTPPDTPPTPAAGPHAATPPKPGKPAKPSDTDGLF